MTHDEIVQKIKELVEFKKDCANSFDTFAGHADNLADEMIELLWTLEQQICALETIETFTRNPNAYQPSYWTINHLAREGLGMK